MTASLLLCSLLIAAPPTAPSAPLTASQVSKLQQVVRKTQDRNDELKQALADRQEELMNAYTRFELDERRIGNLHKEIIDLQRELLENYRELQVELRGIVGEERFAHLKKRIDLILQSKKKVQVNSNK